MRAGFKQDKGMYFTHANLVWFMLEAIDLTDLTQNTWRHATHPNDRMPYVIDPSCGSGTFLLRAMQMITASIRDHRAALVQTQDDQAYFDSHMSDATPNAWAKDYLYGADPKFVMAITAKVNMVLHGDGSAHIYKWDSLRPLSVAPERRLQPLPLSKRSTPTGSYQFDLSEQFDVVVSNPPFSITLAPETQRAVSQTFSLGPSTSSESLFLERYAQLLKPRGRLGVVVPESLLNASDYRESRLLLLRFFYVRAVVSLPRNLFVETPTLTSLLFAQRKTGTEVAVWDADWRANEATIDRAVSRAKLDMKRAALSHGSRPSDIEAAFFGALGTYIRPGSFVKRRGRKAAGILPVKLPADVVTVTEAVGYYDAFLRATGFSQLKRQAVLTLMLPNHGYDWPVYTVDEVGFKLSKRGERIRPNQLCTFVDGSGVERPNVQKSDGPVAPLIKANSPSKIIDYIRRDVKWA